MNSLKNNSHFIRLQTSDSGNTYQEADGTTEVTTEYWDTAGWEGFRFVAAIGAINPLVVDPPADAGTFDVKLQSCDTAGGTYADVTGASATQLVSTDDNKIVIIEVDRPISQFYRAVITPGGTGGTVDGAFVELFEPNGTWNAVQDSKTKSNTVVVNV
jgi:hypothetical protein